MISQRYHNELKYARKNQIFFIKIFMSLNISYLYNDGIQYIIMADLQGALSCTFYYTACQCMSRYRLKIVKQAYYIAEL